jgi:FkbM family methyltransferase
MNNRILILKIFHKGILLMKKFLGYFGVGITSSKNLSELQKRALDSSSFDLEFLRIAGKPEFEKILELIPKSKAQLRQDIMALKENGFKREGFFVEFGATDGISLSNTYMLETEFSWKGILAEPARIWHDSLRENRPNAKIDTSCVWRVSNIEIDFREVYQPELSTVSSFSSLDHLGKARKTGKTYKVRSISLVDLLEKHNAPEYIDYLSIDTEGTEFEILREFNFQKYSFGVISVEHNFTSQRSEIKKLLEDNGYHQKFSNISLFDDWYVAS